MYRQSPITYTPDNLNINARTTSGTSNPIFARDFNSATFDFAAFGTAGFTIKIKGATGTDAPDFTAPASATNRWYYCDIAILNNAGVITDGDTGLVISGDGVTAVNVNTDQTDWLAVDITRTSGNLTSEVTLS